MSEIEQLEQSTCLNCGQPIQKAPGHRKKEYCNDTCRQTAYRKRKERLSKTYQTVETKRGVISEQSSEKLQAARTRVLDSYRDSWKSYTPKMQQVLQNIEQQHGAELAEDVSDALSVEYNSGLLSMKYLITDLQNELERYRAYGAQSEIDTTSPKKSIETMMHWIIEDSQVVDALRQNGFICTYPIEPWYATNCPIQLGGIHPLGNGLVLVAEGVKLKLEKS